MTCKSCEGRRIVYGFGGMKSACKECNGTGRVDKDIVKVDKRTKEFRDEQKD